MPSDLWSLYELMLKSRLFEEAIAKLWHDGLISGEMHLDTGEVAALIMEAGISCKFARVCTQSTIPYARHLEDQVLPNVESINAGVKKLMT